MDIRSNKAGVAGRLSNFTTRFFFFDVVPCASPEGLLQAFTNEDVEIQKKFCLMSGREAKINSRDRDEIWQSRQMLWWQGKEYPRHSPEYQLLLDRVYETLSTLPDFQEDLLATGDDILTHSIGERDPSKTILTEEEFCSRLMNAREKLKERSKMLSMEDINTAAKMIEADGTEAFHTVSGSYGQLTARILIIAHLRRRCGSTDTYPAKPEIADKVAMILNKENLAW